MTFFTFIFTRHFLAAFRTTFHPHHLLLFMTTRTMTYGLLTMFTYQTKRTMVQLGFLGGFIPTFLTSKFFHRRFILTTLRTAFMISSVVKPKALNSSSCVPDSPNLSLTPILLIGTG